MGEEEDDVEERGGRCGHSRRGEGERRAGEINGGEGVEMRSAGEVKGGELEGKRKERKTPPTPLFLFADDLADLVAPEQHTWVPS